MRWMRQHYTPLLRKRVTRANRRANFRHQDSALPSELQNFAKGNFQVLLDVVAQRLQRRYVENLGAVCQFSADRFAH